MAGTATSDVVCVDKPVCETAKDRTCTTQCPCASAEGVCTASNQCLNGATCVAGSKTCKGDTLQTPVELNDVVRESLELTHSEFVTRNVVATLQLDPTLPSVLADRVQMQQVVLNLLMNACEAMVGTPLARRRLTLTTRFVAHAEAAEISVQDNGAGIAPGDTDRIFQPFVTTKAHGLGLGLAICRSVAEAHHGVLWAENAPGGGAVFHIKIPIAGGPP